LNDFELKRFNFEKSLKKEKEKKEKEPHLSAQRPTSPSSAAAHFSSSFFFFSCVADEPTPHVGASLSFLPPLSLLCFTRPCAARIPAAPVRLLQLFLSSEQAN
jgi:hypothetical protein